MRHNEVLMIQCRTESFKTACVWDSAQISRRWISGSTVMASVTNEDIDGGFDAALDTAKNNSIDLQVVVGAGDVHFFGEARDDHSMRRSSC
jgi:hypothetical protein